jgi:hypothetical protein
MISILSPVTSSLAFFWAQIPWHVLARGARKGSRVKFLNSIEQLI